MTINGIDCTLPWIRIGSSRSMAQDLRMASGCSFSVCFALLSAVKSTRRRFTSPSTVALFNARAGPQISFLTLHQ
jgi:hypothetical protein